MPNAYTPFNLTVKPDRTLSRIWQRSQADWRVRSVSVESRCRLSRGRCVCPLQSACKVALQPRYPPTHSLPTPYALPVPCPV
eukprot:3004550-Rhodomonas_salina.2